MQRVLVHRNAIYPALHRPGTGFNRTGRSSTEQLWCKRFKSRRVQKWDFRRFLGFGPGTETVYPEGLKPHRNLRWVYIDSLSNRDRSEETRSIDSVVSQGFVLRIYPYMPRRKSGSLQGRIYSLRLEDDLGQK